MMIPFKIIFFVISAVVASHHHRCHRYHHHHIRLNLEEKSKSNVIFLSDVNKNTQNTMNKLFEYLSLPDNFINKTKIKSLLTMQHDLNNIVLNTFEVYDKLINETAVQNETRIIKTIDFNKLVSDIVNEKHFNVYKKIKHILKIHDNRVSKKRTEISNSTEFRQFIKNFVRKVKNLTVDDLFKKKKSSKLHNSTEANLEVWTPPFANDTPIPNNFTANRRVFGGYTVPIKKYPFIASIHVFGQFFCSGSIIARDLIITAASCLQVIYNNRFFRENPKILTVRIGSSWTLHHGEVVAVLDVFFHPEYDPKTLKHNLAIISLARRIFFKNYRPKVKRIDFDTSEGNLPSNVNGITLLGWGATKRSGIVDNYEKLTVAILEVYPKEDCKEIYSKRFVTETNFCGGFISKGAGACTHDTGAPGIVGGILTGVVSFGSATCGAWDAPTVFTRVGYYADWIESILELQRIRHAAPTTTTLNVREKISYYTKQTHETWPHILPVEETTGTVTLHYRASEDETLNKLLNDIMEGSDSLINDIQIEDFYDDLDDKAFFRNTTLPSTARLKAVSESASIETEDSYSDPLSIETEKPKVMRFIKNDSATESDYESDEVTDSSRSMSVNVKKSLRVNDNVDLSSSDVSKGNEETQMELVMASSRSSEASSFESSAEHMKYDLSGDSASSDRSSYVDD